jgi:hypothetical protein
VDLTCTLEFGHFHIKTPPISALPFFHRPLPSFYGPSSDVARKGKLFGALPVQRLLGWSLSFVYHLFYT